MGGIKMIILTEIVPTVFIMLLLSRIRKISFLFHLDVFKTVVSTSMSTPLRKKKSILSKLESNKNTQVLYKSMCTLKV